jgi:hypothetical protein
MNAIRAIRVPLLVPLALLALGAASFAWADHELPAKVASHFDGQGQPDGWMPREGYLTVMAIIGLLLPLSMVGAGLLTAALPAGSINLPNRDYWLGPERREATVGYIARHMVWLACMALALFIVLNYLVVEGNHETPPRLSNAVWLLLGVFIAGTAAWGVLLALHFSKGPSAAR